MLFNSPGFMFIYLPVVVAMFYAMRFIAGAGLTTGFLVVASLVFYGWWNPAYLPLICGSLVINYLVGRGIEKSVSSKKVILALGIVFNLALLVFFKYFMFFLGAWNDLAGADIAIPRIVLPLAISFFTFQQIAFLVDSYRGLPVRGGFLDYSLFVTFFPQLIAGPIVHHAEMMPQFRRLVTKNRIVRNLLVGLFIFSIGLAKKTIIADGLSPFVGDVFSAADAGNDVSMISAWLGVLSYTFQIYFDFSGYCDMASGAAYMLGIRLPVNFFSPYKSTGIQEFWRRWHITLGRFLKDYLYIPLGGNRCSRRRGLANLFITMVLGGFWHGAGWNFLIWGALHGSYLVIQRLWQGADLAGRLRSRRWHEGASRGLTFLCVILAWVFFRAETTSGALRLLGAMFIPGEGMLAILNGSTGRHILSVGLVAISYLIAMKAPSAYEMLRKFRPVLNLEQFDVRAMTKPKAVVVCALIAGLAMGLALINLGSDSEFLYFQF